MCDLRTSKGCPVSAFVMSVSWKSPTTTRIRPLGLVAEQLTAAEYWKLWVKMLVAQSNMRMLWSFEQRTP